MYVSIVNQVSEWNMSWTDISAASVLVQREAIINTVNDRVKCWELDKLRQAKSGKFHLTWEIKADAFTWVDQVSHVGLPVLNLFSSMGKWEVLFLLESYECKLRPLPSRIFLLGKSNLALEQSSGVSKEILQLRSDLPRNPILQSKVRDFNMISTIVLLVQFFRKMLIF